MDRSVKLILVADDEKMIRDPLENLLIHSGYEVITAANGEEAIKIINAGQKKIDLIVTDFYMPLPAGVVGEQLDGADVALEARKKGIKVILVSSHKTQKSLQEVAEKKSLNLEEFTSLFEAIFPKPFNVNGLLKKIAEILGGDK
ncbi:response regulator [Candidatus Wolfebacteria bacterium]|nr:response regulator [Candidatus Wolfebacteria bacterium]